MSVKRNIAANYLGTAWATLIQIACVPLYIKYLGIEAYGLIGIYILLNVLSSLLDSGLTTVVVRELARFKAGAISIEHIRTLLRSIEFVFLGLGLANLITVTIGARWIAENWLTTVSITVATVTYAFYLMGGLIAMRWFAGLYRSVP